MHCHCMSTPWLPNAGCRIGTNAVLSRDCRTLVCTACARILCDCRLVVTVAVATQVHCFPREPNPTHQQRSHETESNKTAQHNRETQQEGKLQTGDLMFRSNKSFAATSEGETGTGTRSTVNSIPCRTTAMPVSSAPDGTSYSRIRSRSGMLSRCLIVVSASLHDELACMLHALPLTNSVMLSAGDAPAATV